MPRGQSDPRLGERVGAFGVAALPRLVAPKARIGMLAGDVHTWLAWVLLGLVGLHVAAALYHHFVRHDGVLRRMLPGSGA
jgi:cytochrome b561